MQTLRDTATAVSLICRDALPEGAQISNTDEVILGGFPNTCTVCPMTEVCLEDKAVKVSGIVKIAVVEELPVYGVDVVVGNDLGRKEAVTNPIVSESPDDSKVMVVTRSGFDTQDEESNLGLLDLFRQPPEDGSRGSASQNVSETDDKVHDNNVCVDEESTSTRYASRGGNRPNDANSDTSSSSSSNSEEDVSLLSVDKDTLSGCRKKITR